MATKQAEISHKFGGLTMTLDAMKAIYIPSLSALLLSDIHLGKLTHFRRKGIPLPQKGEMDNLDRLDQLIEKYHPSDVMVIGDLFHSEYNSMWRIWLEFLEIHRAVNFHLIGGNHDILPEELYRNSKMILHTTLDLTDEITLSHHPMETENYCICGHIHPGVSIRLNKKLSKKLPCYFETKKIMILPSFGTFTGSVRVDQKPVHIHVTTGEHIFKIQ